MVNATWIAARPQWYFWSIGLTNSVQPYCRFAIITMQMMPKTSWPQRVLGVARVSDWTAVDAVYMVPPTMVFLPVILNLRSIHTFVTRLSNLDTISKVMSQSAPHQ